MVLVLPPIDNPEVQVASSALNPKSQSQNENVHIWTWAVSNTLSLMGSRQGQAHEFNIWNHYKLELLGALRPSS